MAENYKIQGEIRFDNLRKYYIRCFENDFEDRAIPDVLINRFRRKYYLECQTLDLIKLNQKIEDSHVEVILGSDKTIQELLENVRTEIPNLFKVCESIAMLDMIASFGQLVTNQDCYVRPDITDCIAIKSGRHPIRDKVCRAQFTSFRNTNSSLSRCHRTNLYPTTITQRSNLVFKLLPDVT